MRKPLLFILTLFVVSVGCDRKPFVEEKLKFEKISDDCSKAKNEFRMISNFGGERYEFDKCLPADFSKAQMQVSRHGDTVLVAFEPVVASKPSAVFAMTLDIDSYPQYNFLTLGDDTYAIVYSK